MTMRQSGIVVLAELRTADSRVRWQARGGLDRGRLEVICRVQVSDIVVEVPILTTQELEHWLSSPPLIDSERA